MDLFHTNDNREERIELPDADILYVPGFLSSLKAEELYDHLDQYTPWRQDPVRVFGKWYPQPRLTALYGKKGLKYSYSGLTMETMPMTKPITELERRLAMKYGTDFNIVLLNLYRDGQDSNGWHSDDEAELGKNPMIASISLGEERVFHLRHKQRKELKHKITLGHGSLLLMKGSTQHHWQHQLPKSRRVLKPRINLTFRKVVH
jgi:alkylated DNA repair dioxygenase AlkB